ncbi:MAG: hypothetical protein R3B09_03485 [Nannocystaceae bacterium]
MSGVVAAGSSARAIARGRRARAAIAACLALSLASPPTAAAEVQPFPAEGGGEWLHGVWGDDAVIATSSHFGVKLVCREGQVSYAPTGGSSGLGGIKAVVGGGVGEARTYAVVAEEGGVAIWRRGRWELLQAPAIGRETLSAAAIDDAGRLYAAGEHNALYVLDGEQWTMHRYPRAEMASASVRAMVRVGASDLLLVGDEGVLLTYSSGALRRTRLPAGALAGDLQAAWASPDGAAVWLISKTALIRLDLQKGTARSVDVPFFGQVRALAGVSTPLGDRLVVAAQSEIGIYDGARFLRIDGQYVFAEGLTIDGHDGSIYVSSRDGLRRVVVDEPGLAALRERLPPPDPCPLPGDPRAADDAGEDAVGVAPAGGEASAPAALTEVKPHRERFKSLPTFRLSLGPAVVGEAGGGIKSSFALDLFLGGQIGVAPHVAIWPELGYAYSRSPISGGHLIAAGVGPIFGSAVAGVAVMPRLLVGSAADQLGVGVRSSVIGTFGYTILSVEAGHQWLRIGGKDVHEGRVMFGVNVVPLLAVALLGGIIRSFRRPFRRR